MRLHKFFYIHDYLSYFGLIIVSKLGFNSLLQASGLNLVIFQFKLSEFYTFYDEKQIAWLKLCKNIDFYSYWHFSNANDSQLPDYFGHLAEIL